MNFFKNFYFLEDLNGNRVNSTQFSCVVCDKDWHNNVVSKLKYLRLKTTLTFWNYGNIYSLKLRKKYMDIN